MKRNIWSASEMTLDEAIGYGREWVDAGWVWSRGQVGIAAGGYSAVVVAALNGHPTEICYFGCNGHGEPSDSLVPDPRDDGFLGHALAQTQRAWGPGFEISISTTAGAIVFGPDTTRSFPGLLEARRAAP